MTWNAPLPPPSVLAKYNEAFPGCAERIVNAADTQAKHRQHLEEIVIHGNLKSESRGQWMAFVIALTILFGGFALIYLDKNVLGTAFVGGDLVAMIGIFIYGKRDQRQQLRRKAETVKPRSDQADEE